MKDVQRYLKILRDVRAGKAPSKDDLKFFSTFTYSVDEKAINELTNSPEFKNMSPDQISQAMQDSFIAAVQKPEYRSDILDIAQQNTESEIGQRITEGINVALAAGDIISSSKQIRAADRASRRLNRPSAPAPITADPRLGAALNDAQDQTDEISRAIAPAQQSLLDTYLADMNVAKEVSGGQAGTYGALGQVASTRRGRGSLQLAPIADQIGREGETRYDQLLAQKLQENQSIQQSRAQSYPYEIYQYGLDAQAAAGLGATGRQNLRSSLTAAGEFLPGIIARNAARKRFRDTYNQGLPYGPENAKIMADTDYNLRYQDMYDPKIQKQYEDIYGIQS